MKKTILILPILLLNWNSFSQAPAILWQKTFGGSNSETANSIQKTSDGGYVIAGTTSSVDGDVTGNQGSNDFWIVKVNDANVIEWQSTYGGTLYDAATSIQQTNDGGYIVAGYSNSSNGNITGSHGNNDAWVIKLNTLGQLEWQKAIGGSANDYAYGVRQMADGGYLVAGSTNSNNGDVVGNHGSDDILVVKLNSSGSIEWERTLGGTSSERVFSMELSLDGSCFIGGTSNSDDGDLTSNNGSYDFWIVKINSEGTIAWQKTYGATNAQYTKCIDKTVDGGCIVGGWFYILNPPTAGVGASQNYGIMKLDALGNFEWQKIIGTQNYNEYLEGIIQTAEGGYLLVGTNDGGQADSRGSNDIWAVKLDTSGNEEWYRCLGGSSFDSAYGVEQATDGTYLINGSTNSTNGDVTNNHGNTDMWVIKLDNLLSVPNIEDVSILVYPNPSKSILNFQFPNNVIDKVTITDISGKKLFEQTAITNQINVEKLASGIYIIQAFSDGQKFQTKFIKE